MRRVILMLLLGFAATVAAETKEAIFAGGCFWCMQADFDKVPGVVKTIAGYDGGTTPNPNYESVSGGEANYVESVKVIYDPRKVSYRQLLDYYWHHIDPITVNAQFCDHGPQYRSAVFYLDDKQHQQALASLPAIKQQVGMVYTQIVPSTHFYMAEDYHQSYYQKNPLRYEYYRWSCGRDQRIKEVWHEKD